MEETQINNKKVDNNIEDKNKSTNDLTIIDKVKIFYKKIRGPSLLICI